MFTKEMYMREVAVIFLVIGIFHLVRAFNSWSMNIGTWAVPVWLSYVVGVILLIFSWKGFIMSKK